ncbi:hypothetical protein CEXT_446761 [Caerostris extrusa]|uniref:Uncharacterized protein n=1 Tax=Caerostris extrusa TaxID=172846 RepID=A0AAV4RG07_CAEEX|nr:hypothetical protein CEXT_446761 [Caerostris extrusa]
MALVTFMAPITFVTRRGEPACHGCVMACSLTCMWTNEMLVSAEYCRRPALMARTDLLDDTRWDYNVGDLVKECRDSDRHTPVEPAVLWKTIHIPLSMSHSHGWVC